jgi:NADPH-dependent curcumin reductase CurA
MIKLQILILIKSIRMQGYIVSDYFHRFPELVQAVGPLLASGQMKYKEDVVDGLDDAPEAFLGLFRGANFGKLVVKVS